MGPLRQKNLQGGHRLHTPDVEICVLHDIENNLGTSQDGVHVWPNRWKRLRGSVNVPSHIPWQIASLYITQHLEPFIGVCVNMGPLRQTNVQGSHRLHTPDVEMCSPWYWEQPWNKLRWCSCMAKQVETVERQHECTESYHNRQHHCTSHNIWNHLLVFVWTWVLWDRRTCRAATDCIHQMWRYVFSMILRTTLVQAPGKCFANMVWAKGRLSVSYMKTAIISITSNVRRDYHWWIFLYRKDCVAGLCNRPSSLWDFCIWSSSLMKRPLVTMA